VPRIAGAPASTPSPAKRASDALAAWPPFATGATIASPSVVLCSAKPTISEAPSAS
jgi:hypothetical protein